jgi:hypothetical protein
VLTTPTRSGLLLSALVAVAATAVIASAQQRRGGGPSAVPYCYQPSECPRTAYDGRFTFVRLYFDTRNSGRGFGSGRFGGGGGEPGWHHDRPEAEYNLSAIMRELSTLRTFDGITGGNVFGLDDREVFRYPVIWVSEPGYWVPDDDHVRSLREYLLKGGFMIFDDFQERRGDFDNLVAQMRRVLPELRPIQLTGAEQIFHSFFDIDLNALQLGDLTYGPLTYWGLFEDNDVSKRQIAIMNVNNDIGEYMEFSATGFYPVDITNEAYKLATNYIIYALTH